MPAPVLRLRNKRDRRVRAGHPWVFSNELDTDVAALPPGGTVDIADANGRFVGRGYANPRSLIAVRLLTTDSRDDIDRPDFYAARLTEALTHRTTVCPGRSSLRLVHAEGDGLPGLVIDRYGSCLAVQITTLGLQVRKELIETAIREVLAPEGAVLRSEGKARALEGLDDERGRWFGAVPEVIDIEEHGVTFRVQPLAGQKTGHFFDQADNRHFAASLCTGRTVLDVYAHNGAWALHALRSGATHATTIDRSEEACAQTVDNAALNGVTDRIEVMRGDGRKTMEALREEGRRFGAVVVDPPAFAKRKREATAALKGYTEMNIVAMRLLEPGGLLFTSSCSYHIEEDRFVDTIHAAAQRVKRRIRLIRRGEQAADHPVVPGIPESRYLKNYAVYVS